MVLRYRRFQIADDVYSLPCSVGMRSPSHLSFGPSSMGRGNSTVIALIVLFGYIICEALLNSVT